MRLLDAPDYQPAATALYDKLADEFRRLLPDAVIEHIGSSAVPGVISKGDLDVFVGVRPDHFAAAARAIWSAGFHLKQGTLRTPQLNYFTSDDYPIDVGIQLVELGSRFEFFRIFRDLLRSDESLRNRYNQAKKEAAALDEDGYRDRKTKFIEAALREPEQHPIASAQS